MAMEPLGGKFAECARDILKEAAGEEPPTGFPTAMLENMIKEITEPSGRVPEDMTYMAMRSAACLAKGGAKELSDDELKTVIKRHFTI